MKIAVSAKGGTPESEVDPRFGRAVCFVVCDTVDSMSARRRRPCRDRQRLSGIIKQARSS
jgi:hypothetical protein